MRQFITHQDLDCRGCDAKARASEKGEMLLATSEVGDIWKKSRETLGSQSKIGPGSQSVRPLVCTVLKRQAKSSWIRVSGLLAHPQKLPTCTVDF